MATRQGDNQPLFSFLSPFLLPIPQPSRGVLSASLPRGRQRTTATLDSSILLPTSDFTTTTTQKDGDNLMRPIFPRSDV